MAQPIIGDDPRTLVSTDWLAAHLNDPDLRILDASYYLPDMGRDALAEYEAGISPARGSSTSTRFPTHAARCPTWPPRSRSS
jgi:thiosulfate/3-mercaptopyruvate sulfurtransferase